jgi:hypothetical protein
MVCLKREYMKKIFRVLAVLVAVFSLVITQVQHINAQ